jgi:hypothetical protein
MTTYTGLISWYQLVLWSSSSLTEPGTRLIMCEATAATGLPGAPGFGVNLYFVPTGQKIPNPSQSGTDVANGIFKVYTPIDDYWAFLDLLRNSSAVYFSIADTDLNDWSLMPQQSVNVGQGLVTNAVTAPASPSVKLNIPPNFTGRLPALLKTPAK